MNNDLLILVKDLNDGINLFKTYVYDWNNMINDKDSLYNTLNYDLKRFLFNSYCNKIIIKHVVRKKGSCILRYFFVPLYPPT